MKTLTLEYERLFWALYPLPAGSDEQEAKEYGDFVRRQAERCAAEDAHDMRAPTFEDLKERSEQLACAIDHLYGGGYRREAA